MDTYRTINHNELDLITNGVFNTPVLRKPCIVFEDDSKAILYADSDTEIFNTSFVYLRKPLEMTLETPVVDVTTNECELDNYTHQDIVELAVDMYIREYKYLLAQKGE